MPKSLYQTAKKEFYRNPIQVSVAILILLNAMLHFLGLMGASLDPISSLISQTIEVSLLSQILSLLLLFLTLVSLHKQKTKFINYGGVSWKMFISPDYDIRIDFPSYCIKHRLKHIQEVHNYICPRCNSDNVPSPYFFEQAQGKHKNLNNMLNSNNQ